MKRFARSLGLLGIVWVAFAGAARAANLDDAVILVATPELDGTPLEQAVVLATPLPGGTHIGFILNKPTKLRLDQLFPDHAPSRNVREPTYLGGPAFTSAVFAITRKAPKDAKVVLPLVPGVLAVFDAASVDRVIESTPNDARYFLGVMYWDAGELEDQVDQNAWETGPADADVVLPRSTRGLWNALRKPMA